MCGGLNGLPNILPPPPQVLSNLVMEELLPELKNTIGPRLKGKAPERQRTWIQVWCPLSALPLPAQPARGLPCSLLGCAAPFSRPPPKNPSFLHSGFFKALSVPLPGAWGSELEEAQPRSAARPG